MGGEIDWWICTPCIGGFLCFSLLMFCLFYTFVPWGRTTTFQSVR